MSVFAIIIKKPAVPPPYTPPEGDSVPLNFTGGYVPPDNENTNFIFPD